MGITNEDKTFFIAFSFCSSESAASFIFFFDSLRAEFFNTYVPEPTVVLLDLAASIISAFDTHKAMPHSKLQFCSWHVEEAIQGRFSNVGRYTKQEIIGWTDKNTSIEHNGLKHYIWCYIQSNTKAELDTNRANLLSLLQVEEQRYLTDNYLSKEQRFVACYTHRLKNLGQNATQRSESYYRVLKDVTHYKLSLEESAKALYVKLNNIYTRLAIAEDQAALNRFTAIDLNFFRLLVGSVSLFAIKRIQAE